MLRACKAFIELSRWLLSTETGGRILRCLDAVWYSRFLSAGPRGSLQGVMRIPPDGKVERHRLYSALRGRDASQLNSMIIYPIDMNLDVARYNMHG
jgi:hypothetical protein